MIDWNDNAKQAVIAFYEFIDEQGVSYASPDKMQKDFFEWLGLSQQKTAADAVKQEGEKWTHTYTDDTGTDIRCRLLAEHGELAWVEDAGTVDTIRKSWLKPIKPTISEDAVSKLRAYANWTAGQESGYVSELIEEFIATHDII